MGEKHVNYRDRDKTMSLITNYFIVKTIFSLPGRVLFTIVLGLGICLCYARWGMLDTVIGVIIGLVIVWIVWMFIGGMDSGGYCKFDGKKRR